MTVKELINSNIFKIVHKASNVDVEIENVYCCDMLSIAMSKMPQKAAWVTVVGNVNTLAVATLTEASCIILAEGMQLDKAALSKVEIEDITVLTSEEPTFSTAYSIYKYIEV